MHINERKEITQQEVDYAKGGRESHIFARRNPDFPMNARNAETLQRELMKRNLAWTAENLQIVWNEIDRYLIDDSEDKRPEAKPPRAVSVDAKEAVPEFPWGVRLEGDEGKARVVAMSGEDFQKFLTNRHTGSEFAAQVKSLGIKQVPFRS